jgi:hypothetical protein
MLDRSCDRWAAMLAEARKLSDADLKRQATVSIDNAHQCVECFTCACAAVQEERQKRT